MQVYIIPGGNYVLNRFAYHLRSDGDNEYEGRRKELDMEGHRF